MLMLLLHLLGARHTLFPFPQAMRFTSLSCHEVLKQEKFIRAPPGQSAATPGLPGHGEEPVLRSCLSVLHGPEPQKVRPLDFSAKGGLGQSPEEILVQAEELRDLSSRSGLSLICCWAHVLVICPQFTLSKMRGQPRPVFCGLQMMTH